MDHYRFTVQMGRIVGVINNGSVTKSGDEGPEYCTALILEKSENSAWLVFASAKAGAVSWLKSHISITGRTLSSATYEIRALISLLEQVENLEESVMVDRTELGLQPNTKN